MKARAGVGVHVLNSRAIRGFVSTGLAALALGFAGCGLQKEVDTTAARTFRAYPLYWVGARFERWELVHVDVAATGFSTFIYGDCKVDDPDGSGPEGGSCTPPLQIQIQPLCTHLDVVARARIWEHRKIRGAPVGTIDSAPVMFTRAAQVKVYRGQGTDLGLPLRALQALRSINKAKPVLGVTERIPAPAPGVLDGRRPCRSA